MGQLTTWPAYSNDSGAGTDGTAIDTTFLNSVKTAIEDDVKSATNPTIATKTIIDEVVEARGSKATLDARLDVFLNEDGTPRGSVAFPTSDMIRTGVGAQNLLTNEDYLVWSAGDTALPDRWDGGSATFQRTGVGLADTAKKHGPFALRLTGSGAAPTISQTPFSATELNRLVISGRVFSFGIRVKTANSGVTAFMSDGVNSAISSAHSGSASGGPESDGWEWLSVSITIAASFSTLQVGVIGASAADVVYVSGGTLFRGVLSPADWVPSPRSIHTINMVVPGVQAVATDVAAHSFSRPSVIQTAQLHIKTAPTGQALIVDINHWDGAAFQSMFGTRPQLGVAATDGGSGLVFGTYRYQCFSGRNNGLKFATTDNLLSVDVDQVGSGTAGTLLTIVVQYLQYDRALDGRIIY